MDWCGNAGTTRKAATRARIERLLQCDYRKDRMRRRHDGQNEKVYQKEKAEDARKCGEVQDLRSGKCIWIADRK